MEDKDKKIDQEIQNDVQEKTFGVYIPTCNRYARGMITAKWFENAKHVVRKSQEQLYKDAGFTNIVAVEDSKINRYSKVFDWILNNTEEDVVVIADDDIKDFVYRLEYNYKIESVETVQAEFERLAQLLLDLDLGLAFGSATPTPYGYTSEFGWLGIPGAFKVINKKCIKAKLDIKTLRNCDIDYVLQELALNRICINAKYLVDNPYEDDTTYTSGAIYSVADIASATEIMKAKWGQHFSYNENRNVPTINVKR